MIRILFLALIGYLLYKLIRLSLMIRNTMKNSQNIYESRTGGKEKDISGKAQVLDEKWLDKD